MGEEKKRVAMEGYLRKQAKKKPSLKKPAGRQSAGPKKGKTVSFLNETNGRKPEASETRTTDDAKFRWITSHERRQTLAPGWKPFVNGDFVVCPKGCRLTPVDPDSCYKVRARLDLLGSDTLKAGELCPQCKA